MDKKTLRVNHIGYAVEDLSKATESFLRLGYRVCRGETEDRPRNVKICFLSDPGGVKVELIAPIVPSNLNEDSNKDSPIASWLQKNGNSPYHICYDSEDIALDIAALKKQGYLLVTRPLPAPAMDGRLVAFMYGKNVGLIELAEKAKGIRKDVSEQGNDEVGADTDSEEAMGQGAVNL
ncbi:MAG: VOC family protein [Synergistaceae bacterium]|jgi:methylmalonyl-CoA/ethylmalonyl-CoA epimerase|nr:VOC family protein [Synergistaceae bacterium]